MRKSNNHLNERLPAMIIIGEKINTSRKNVEVAVENRDTKEIAKIALEQADAGAHYIDVNAGTFLEKEPECLEWLTETVQGEVDLPLCIDSPSPEAIERAMKKHRGEPMINSISLEEDRYRDLLPVITSRPCKVVALCMAKSSMPVTADDRISVASELVEKLTKQGISLENIYVDPLVQPVSVDTSAGIEILKAISGIMERFPGVNTVCGLSNISFGLPARKLVNRNFLTLAVSNGLNAAILDPTDKKIMAGLAAARMLLGRDEYCSEYMDAYEKGLL